MIVPSLRVAGARYSSLTNRAASFGCVPHKFILQVIHCFQLDIMDSTGEALAEEDKPAALEFITFTDPRQIKNRETKKRVRGHVMRGIQRSARQAREERGDGGKIVLDVSYLIPPASSGSAPQQPRAHRTSSSS
jgi:hypothetical protein